MSSLSLSRVPQSWVVFHGILCIFGVANISFGRLVPCGLRMTSVIYNVIVLLCTLSVLLMFFGEINWKQDVFYLIESLDTAVWSGIMAALSITSLVNVFGGHSLNFLLKWNAYIEKAGDISHLQRRHECLNWWCVYIVIVISRVLVHVCVIAIYIPMIKITDHGFVQFSFAEQ